MTNDVIGKPLDRVDGKLKVTGRLVTPRSFPPRRCLTPWLSEAQLRAER